MTLAAIDRSNIPDHAGSKERADALAKRIEDYWRDRGAQILIWAQHETRAEKTTNSPLYVIRSNLVGGLPRRRLS